MVKRVYKFKSERDIDKDIDIDNDNDADIGIDIDGNIDRNFDRHKTKITLTLTLAFGLLIVLLVIYLKFFADVSLYVGLTLGWVGILPVFLVNRKLTIAYGFIVTVVFILLSSFKIELFNSPTHNSCFIFIFQSVTFIAISILLQMDKLSTLRNVKQKEEEIKRDLNKSLNEEVIDALLKAVNAKDSYTYKHSRRVAYYCMKLAGKTGLDKDMIKRVRMAALLHDIGKIGMKDNILNKSSGLDEMEYIEAKEHVVIGARIAKNLDFLEDITPIILYHHERYDGKGYPEQLKGEDIPIGSRIISICDSFDAMTFDREYRKAMPVDLAIQKIMQDMGTRYDPLLCLTFADLIRNDKIFYSDVTSP